MKNEYFHPPLKISAERLQLNDRIRLSFMHSPFNVAVVKNVTEDYVHLFRPYIHTSDFSSTAGVICYHGHEDFALHRKSKEFNMELLERCPVD